MTCIMLVFGAIVWCVTLPARGPKAAFGRFATFVTVGVIIDVIWLITVYLLMMFGITTF